MTNYERLQKSPIDFLYIFATDDYLAKVQKYISKKAANTIRTKRANQATMLYRMAQDLGKSFDALASEVSSLIQQQYGISVGNILLKLLAGEPVAGKDYKKGVYGVGSTPLTTFTQNSNVSVDPTTGKIKLNGTDLSNGYPTMQDRQTVAFTYNIGGNTYTSKLNTATGQWYANTYGTADAMQFADGSTYTASKSSSVWENISTATSLIEKLVTWILSLFGSGNRTLLTADNTLPSQEEYITNDTNIAGFGIVGAVILGGVLLGTAYKKK